MQLSISNNIFKSVYTCIFVIFFMFFAVIFFGSGIFHKEVNGDEVRQMLVLATSDSFKDFLLNFDYGMWLKLCAYVAYFFGADSIDKMQSSSVLISISALLVLFGMTSFSTKNITLAFLTPTLLFISNYFEWVSSFSVNGYIGAFLISSLMTWFILADGLSKISNFNLILMYFILFFFGFSYTPFAIYASFLAGGAWISAYALKREHQEGFVTIQRLKRFVFTRISLICIGICITSLASVALYLSLDPHGEISHPRPEIHQFYFALSEYPRSVDGFFSWSYETMVGTFYSMFRPLRFWASEGFSIAWALSLFLMMVFGIVISLRERRAMAVIALAFLGNLVLFYALGSISVYAFGDIRYAITLWPAALVFVIYGANGLILFAKARLQNLAAKRVAHVLGHAAAVASLVAATALIGHHAFSVYDVTYRFNQSFDNQIALINASDVEMVVIDDRVKAVLDAESLVDQPLFPIPRRAHVSENQYRERLATLEMDVIAASGENTVSIGLLTYFDLDNYPELTSFLEALNCVQELNRPLNRWQYRIFNCPAGVRE